VPTSKADSTGSSAPDAIDVVEEGLKRTASVYASIPASGSSYEGVAFSKPNIMPLKTFHESGRIDSVSSGSSSYRAGLPATRSENVGGARPSGSQKIHGAMSYAAGQVSFTAWQHSSHGPASCIFAHASGDAGIVEPRVLLSGWTLAVRSRSKLLATLQTHVRDCGFISGLPVCDGFRPALHMQAGFLLLQQHEFRQSSTLACADLIWTVCPLQLCCQQTNSSDVGAVRDTAVRFAGKKDQ
jgi:hypothetical protein